MITSQDSFSSSFCMKKSVLLAKAAWRTEITTIILIWVAKRLKCFRECRKSILFPFTKNIERLHLIFLELIRLSNVVCVWSDNCQVKMCKGCRMSTQCIRKYLSRSGYFVPGYSVPRISRPQNISEMLAYDAIFQLSLSASSVFPPQH